MPVCLYTALACALICVCVLYVSAGRPPEADVYTAQAAHSTGITLTQAEKDARLNLNTATLDELMTLPGIGSVTAQRILALREQLGAFHYIEDLLHVQGIGEKKIDVIYDLVYAE